MQENKTAFEIFEAEREELALYKIKNSKSAKEVYSQFSKAFEKVRTWNKPKKVAFFMVLIEQLFEPIPEEKMGTGYYFNGDAKQFYFWQSLFDDKLKLNETDAATLLSAFCIYAKKHINLPYQSQPLLVLQKIEKTFKTTTSAELYQSLKTFRKNVYDGNLFYPQEKDKTKIIRLVDSIIAKLFQEGIAANLEIVTSLKSKELLESEFVKFDAITEDFLKNIKNNPYFFAESDIKSHIVYKNHIKNWIDDDKINFIIYCTIKIQEVRKKYKELNSTHPEYRSYTLYQAFLKHLLKDKLRIKAIDFENILATFLAYRNATMPIFIEYPIESLLKQVVVNKGSKYSAKALGLVVFLKNYIENEEVETHFNNDKSLILREFYNVLTEKEEVQILEIEEEFDGKDSFAAVANSLIYQLAQGEKQFWYKMLAHAKKASGTKPTQSYLKICQSLLENVDKKRFLEVIKKIVRIASETKIIEHPRSYTYGNGNVYNYSEYEYISSTNVEILKGLLWVSIPYCDVDYLKILGKLLDKTQEKIPGKGPCALGLGNACLYLFAQANSLEGVAQLSRAKLRVKQSNTLALIEKYLTEAAEKQGITISELEDLAVEDFGLTDGTLAYELGEYCLTIQLKSVGKVEQIWQKKDGTLLKTVPASVKKDFAAELKNIKEQVKQIETTSTSQRDRLDRMFRTERKMTWAHFEKYYLQHGLMSFLAKKILWNFEENGNKTTAFWSDNQWINENGTIVNLPQNPSVSLWHPVFASQETVLEWRNFFIEKEILQPLKQAFREVYILTDAELRTDTYSNRMAAHVLKQHQFNSLAKLRGWKYALLGAYDDGRDGEIAVLQMPDYQFNAQFWVNPINADNEWNGTGIWNYISTDQVRFSNNHGVLRLSEIPLLPFSEAMRDIDMFVGVASIGNDPNWTDNSGLPRYNNYWESQSFGELGETAKVRAAVLKKLVPRLKIASLCTLEDKFLVVKGKIRTYKIHLGSGNILMTPNDQYLCIVPDGSKKTSDEKVFLPFEGDSILSIILSKAFLLAEDDKITDSTIVRQIK